MSHPHFGIFPAPNPADRCTKPRESNPSSGGVFIDRREGIRVPVYDQLNRKLLMPSCRFAHVRFLLKEGGAKVGEILGYKYPSISRQSIIVGTALPIR